MSRPSFVPTGRGAYSFDMINVNPFDRSGGLPVQLSPEAAKLVNNTGNGWNSSRIAFTVLAHLAAIFRVLGGAKTASVTLSTDTNIYASGDVLADTQAITGVVEQAGQALVLDSIVVLDKDDQAAADIDLVLLSENVSLGAENAAPNITDANASKILGIVTVPAENFLDAGGAKIATVRNVGLVVVPVTTALYIAAITRGTPTQTAAGIVVNLGFRRA
jgi:hypothetical protein